MSNRIVVIGTGPIGGIIGGRLARAGHDISFVDIDKEHLKNAPSFETDQHLSWTADYGGSIDRYYGAPSRWM